MTSLPVIELGRIFWKAGLAATPRDEWVEAQRKLVEKPSWIMDGDFGPYDVVQERLREADAIVFMDFSLRRCAWRAIRRSSEGGNFWRWVLRIGVKADRC